VFTGRSGRAARRRDSRGVLEGDAHDAELQVGGARGFGAAGRTQSADPGCVPECSRVLGVFVEDRGAPTNAGNAGRHLMPSTWPMPGRTRRVPASRMISSLRCGFGSSARRYSSTSAHGSPAGATSSRSSPHPGARGSRPAVDLIGPKQPVAEAGPRSFPEPSGRVGDRAARHEPSLVDPWPHDELVYAADLLLGAHLGSKAEPNPRIDVCRLRVRASRSTRPLCGSSGVSRAQSAPLRPMQKVMSTGTPEVERRCAGHRGTG
jgi:hypothetical protein